MGNCSQIKRLLFVNPNLIFDAVTLHFKIVELVTFIVSGVKETSVICAKPQIV